MNTQPYHVISGREKGERLASRLLEERIQTALLQGVRQLEINAYGQHGIGGRLWNSGGEAVDVKVKGHPGQRLGAMGYPNTHIELFGPASDDVGWLNTGAQIVIHGNAGNGVANAMAQGKIFVGGNIGARGMTMTKHNPRFEPPELWVLGGVGDYFGEFMAGGVAVICGYEPQNRDNVLGYRPIVGMVGGEVFFRGSIEGYSEADALLTPISDDQLAWLFDHLKRFLDKVGRSELFKTLAVKEEWQLIRARTTMEKRSRSMVSMRDFHHRVWEAELGTGGLVGDLTDLDRSPIPLVPTGELRRFVPVWENRTYLAPCEATCPSGIPVQQRWQLIREGRLDEAVDLALAYTPFPAAVCGYLCPNPCMKACTKQEALMAPVDVHQLGRASIGAGDPELPQISGKRVAVIGGGPAGISTAWQLRLKGHDAVIFDQGQQLGGKVTRAIPNLRIPAEIVQTELERVRRVLPHVELQQKIGPGAFAKLRAEFDFVVVAVGAQKPRTLPVPGAERAIKALDFLADAKSGKTLPGKRVVVIGAGNVGCDVAAMAHRLGAEQITLIDVQQPASFGKEREEAEKAGAVFRWPCFTKEVTGQGVVLTDGELLPADSVYISIGDAPELDFLTDDVQTEQGFITVNEFNQTSAPAVFAIGDAIKLGLLTDAIGQGRRAAEAIDDIHHGRRPAGRARRVIDTRRVTLEYFDPRIVEYSDMQSCSSNCSSCGSCRDCELCVSLCPQAAISRQVPETGGYEYVVNADLCIGCGFCSAVCPCGVWNLVENSSLS